MRTSVSGVGRCIGVLLKGRCNECMKKQDVSFGKGSQQARGYGPWVAVFVLEVKRPLGSSLSEVGRLRGDVPVGILSCLKVRKGMG